MENIIYLDVAILVFGMALLVRGLWTGFIKQVTSIIALLLAFVIAGKYYGACAQYIAPYITSPKVGFVLAYTFLFLVIYLFIYGLGFLMKNVMSVILLGWFDRFMGGVFGAFKAAFIVSLIFVVVSSFAPKASDRIQQSLFYPFLIQSSKMMLSLLKGDDFRSQFVALEPAIPPLLARSIPPGQDIIRNGEEISPE